MKTVNYYILRDIFGLLERIGLIDGVDFLKFDTDCEADVRVIARDFIRPAFLRTSPRKRDLIRWSFEYYCHTKSAPLQQFYDECQELYLQDSQDWERFFRWIGEELFSPASLDVFDGSEYVEVLNLREGELIFANNDR